MYSSARAASLNFSWMASTRFISAVASLTRASLPMPIEASVRSGLTNSGIRRLPPVSKSSLEKTAKSGYRILSKASAFLASPLSCRRYSSPGPPPV